MNPVLPNAVDDFLAMVSHELRTPLTPILGWAHLIKTAPDAAHIAHAAEIIERNALRQLRLIEDLIDLARSRQGGVRLSLVAHDIGPVLRAAVAAMRSVSDNHGVALAFDDYAGALDVNGDPDRLEQVFRHVMLNAIRFTPAGGEVRMTLSSAGGVVVVEVRDSGRGIAPAFLPFVFDMFRQEDSGTRRTHAGLGIGLALVKIVIDAHGGSVAVASDGRGLGTLVTVRLPAAGAGAFGSFTST